MEHQQQSTLTPEQIFTQIRTGFLNKNSSQLAHSIRMFYRNQNFSQVDNSDWRIDLQLNDIRRQPMGAQFGDIMKAMRQFKEIKTRKGCHFAFKTHINILTQVMGLYEESQQSWIYKPLRQIVRASKRIFLQAEYLYHKTGASGVNVKKDDLIYALQRFKATRGMKQETKQQILPLIDNMQVSIMLRYHNYDQIRRILEPKKSYGEHGPLFENNYYFQRGKVALINEKMQEAQQYLERIKVKTVSQKRLVLKYLIPCKMFLGKMFKPKPENQDQYFPEYAPIINAIIKANFEEYTEAIENYQKVWIKRGIYLLMDRLRKIVWRNLIKKVSKIQGYKIDITDIQVAAKISGAKQKNEECICIISNLIYEGYIKGYIFQNQQKRVLVLKKDGGFPKLAAINR